MFAAFLKYPDTNDEYMIVTNTAEEAETLGLREVGAAIKKGMRVEICVGQCPSGSWPLREVIDMSDWR
jgi:hypothetical protein